MERFVGKQVLIQDALMKAKGEVLKEFEKVCHTDRSFERVKKDMHDIFDALATEIVKTV